MNVDVAKAKRAMVFLIEQVILPPLRSFAAPGEFGSGQLSL